MTSNSMRQQSTRQTVRTVVTTDAQSVASPSVRAAVPIFAKTSSLNHQRNAIIGVLSEVKLWCKLCNYKLLV